MATLAALLLLALPSALSQNAPDCDPSLSFLDNDLKQDPCHVQSWLYSQCSGVANYTLWDLGTTYSAYPGPTSTDQSQWVMNACLCSMPVYNLAMACQSACQGKNVLLWSQWTGSCNSSFTGSSNTPTLAFPQPVPSGTEIPPWAMIDNRNQPWSEQEAQTNVSGTTKTSSSPSTSKSRTGTPSPTSGGGGGGSKSNAGAIAGGVVGGIAVISILGLGAMYYLRRRRQTSKPAIDEFGMMGEIANQQVTPYTQPGTPGLHSGTPDSRHWSVSQGGHGSYPTTTTGENPFNTNTPSPRPDASSQGHSTGVYVPEVMSSTSSANIPTEPDVYPDFPGRR